MTISDGSGAAVDGQLTVPFELRGRRGTVNVTLDRNDDPEDLGHPLIAFGYDREAFVGFPAIRATVDYAGDGYRAVMASVQVFERHNADGTVTAEVDSNPIVFGEGSPLYAFGYCPTFADYPANPHHPDRDWLADAFLTGIPDIARSRVLEPAAGFRWSYRLEAGRPTELFTPQRVGTDTWQHHRPTLRETYPTWDFKAPERLYG